MHGTVHRNFAIFTEHRHLGLQTALMVLQGKAVGMARGKKISPSDYKMKRAVNTRLKQLMQMIALTIQSCLAATHRPVCDDGH